MVISVLKRSNATAVIRSMMPSIIRMPGEMQAKEKDDSQEVKGAG